MLPQYFPNSKNKMSKSILILSLLFCLLCLSTQAKESHSLKKKLTSKIPTNQIYCLNVKLKSEYWNNLFVRGQGSGNIVNLQFGDFSWEQWIATQYYSGYYCFENNNFRGKFLSLNIDNCNGFQGSGCGYAYLSDSCSNVESQFLVVNNDNVHVGLRSYKAFLQNAKRKIYLRLAGNGLTSFQGSGGGNVNAQDYGTSGGDPDGYEKIRVQLTSYCS